MCLPPPVPSPGPSPSSLAAPHPHAGLRRSTSLLSLWSSGKRAVLWMSQNLRYWFFSDFFILITSGPFRMQHKHVIQPLFSCSVSRQRCWWGATGSSYCGHTMQWDEYRSLPRCKFNCSSFGIFAAITTRTLLNSYFDATSCHRHPFLFSGNQGCGNWAWNYTSDHSWWRTETERVWRYSTMSVTGAHSTYWLLNHSSNDDCKFHFVSKGDCLFLS